MVTERPSSLSASEAFVLVAACVIAATGAVTWGGAALAAALNGFRLEGGLGAAIRATARLPEQETWIRKFLRSLLRF